MELREAVSVSAGGRPVRGAGLRGGPLPRGWRLGSGTQGNANAELGADGCDKWPTGYVMVEAVWPAQCPTSEKR